MADLEADLKTTAMVVFGALLAVGLYDVGAIVVAGGDSVVSVSQFITDISARPRIAFVAVLLTCHFFGWMMFPRVKND